MFQVAGVGSSLAMEPCEALQTQANSRWEGLACRGQVLPLFLACRKEAPRFFTGLVWGGTPNTATHPANPRTHAFGGGVPTYPGPTPGLLRLIRTGSSQGCGIESQPHLLSASLLTSHCVRFHICKMGVTTSTSPPSC